MPSERINGVEVPGLNALMRDIRQLGKPAEAALRDEAQLIAKNRMVPAWTDAAMNAGPWSGAMSKRIVVRRDRVPSVRIGSNTKDYGTGRGELSGKPRKMQYRASTNMLRWPSNHGVSGKGSGNRKGAIKAFGQGTRWIAEASKHYKREAMEDYGQALARVVTAFNHSGRVY